MIKSSDTRELLNLIGFDQMISFAGGLPAEEGFPIAELNEVMKNFMSTYGAKAMQYGPTEGIRPLRELIAERITKKHGKTISYKNILITSGSQQALDIIGKTFIDQGDELVVEEPTYFSAINAFKTYEPSFIGVKTDDEGALTDEVEEKLTDKTKLAYYIPDFQNPSGRLWSKQRKEAILKIHQNKNIPIVEDCPYADIQFEGEKVPSFLSMDQGGLVIHLGSFSKVFCPGFRLGYIVADEAVIKQCVLLKQSMDLHTSTFTQYIMVAYMEQFSLDNNIEKIRKLYMKKRNVMVDAIKKYMSDQCHFTEPKGGMFLWLELNNGVDTRKLYEKALENQVAFVAGDAFYLDAKVSNGLRLNYTNMSDEQIKVGIKRLSQLI